MVTFIPFKGYRPRLKVGETIISRVSPPYDVIDDEELKELQSNPCNVTNLTLNPDADKRYTGARKLLDRMVEETSVMQDPPSFYMYDQTFTVDGTEYRRRGYIGLLKAEEYSAGNVLPHEDTSSKVKADRLNLLKDLEAHVESVFGIFPGLGDELSRRVDGNARLCCRFVDRDGVEHRFSRVEDPDVCAAVTEKLKDQKMLIADGHHRYETALEYAKQNPGCEAKQYVLCTMVASDDKGLVIRPTHRMVDAEDIGETSAVKKISKKMKVTEVSEEEMEAQLKDHLFGMILRSGKCLLLDNLDDNNDGMMKLDVYSAQANVLNGVYKADEGKSKISYSADLSAVKQEMADKKHDSAVILHAPSIETIWNIAEQGRKMPKKSTFFYPKIWSGLVIYRMG